MSIENILEWSGEGFDTDSFVNEEQAKARIKQIIGKLKVTPDHLGRLPSAKKAATFDKIQDAVLKGNTINGERWWNKQVAHIKENVVSKVVSVEREIDSASDVEDIDRVSISTQLPEASIQKLYIKKETKLKAKLKKIRTAAISTDNISLLRKRVSELRYVTQTVDVRETSDVLRGRISQVLNEEVTYRTYGPELRNRIERVRSINDLDRLEREFEGKRSELLGDGTSGKVAGVIRTESVLRKKREELMVK